MSLLNDCEKALQDGLPVKIDIKKQTVRIGPNLVSDFSDIGYDTKTDEFPKKLEELYDNYFFSMPETKKSKCLFESEDPSKLTVEQMVTRDDMPTARMKLELYVLAMAKQGFDWSRTHSNWFWQSKVNPKLIILKDWVVSPETAKVGA